MHLLRERLITLATAAKRRATRCRVTSVGGRRRLARQLQRSGRKTAAAPPLWLWMLLLCNGARLDVRQLGGRQSVAGAVVDGAAAAVADCAGGHGGTASSVAESVHLVHGPLLLWLCLTSITVEHRIAARMSWQRLLLTARH